MSFIFKNINILEFLIGHNLLPLLPLLLLVESVGTGVTSSILPILIPALAKALKAVYAPGPGLLIEVPPLPLNLICIALTFNSFNLFTTS